MCMRLIDYENSFQVMEKGGKEAGGRTRRRGAPASPASSPVFAPSFHTPISNCDTESSCPDQERKWRTELRRTVAAEVST